MTDPARRRRIAELLCKAIQMASVSDALEVSATPDVPARPASVALSEGDRVLNFLRVVGEASPAAIRQSLGLSRSGVFRTLQRLAHERQVAAHGQTRTLVYRLTRDAPPPDRIALN